MVKKRIIAVLLAALLVLAVIPINALATDGEVVEVANFDEFKENVVKDGATLKLTADITMTEKVTINNNVTIDGNGNKILGQNDDTSVYIEIMGGKVTFQNVLFLNLEVMLLQQVLGEL